LLAEISHFMGGILVKTAGNDFPIPGNHTGAPHAEAGVWKRVFNNILVDRWAGGQVARWRASPVPGILFRFRHQRIAIFKVVELGGFELQFINTQVFCQFPDGIQLMFV
jgi:hypothetical protein